MRKSTKLVSIMGGLLVAAAVTGCQANGSSSVSGGEDSKDIYVQLVPSNDPATLMTRATALEPYLTKYEEASGYVFHISVGTSYAATTTALENGKLDAGFLTASGYAQATIDHPGTVDVLLQALRAGYKVQSDDFPGFTDEAKEKQRKAMNGEITTTGDAVTSANASSAYVYRGEQSNTPVSYYSGLVIARRDAFSTTLTGAKSFDSDHDGVITLKELHDNKAKIGIMGATSGSGYIYPTYMLYKLGYTKGFVSEDSYNALSADDQAKAFIGVNMNSYPAGVTNLMNGTIDAACGFMDIRYGSAYVQSGSQWENNPEVFTDTYTVAITDPIVNDTICSYSGISDAKKAAIKDAFKKAAADGSKTTENTPAWMLYQIYSHTGYSDAKDSDYDSVRDMYRWQLTHTN